MTSKGLVFLSAALGLVLSMAIGCGGESGDESNGSGETSSKDVDKIEVDGFVVLGANTSFQLFDPSTGKHSDSYPIGGFQGQLFEKIAISPDGAHIAWTLESGIGVGRVVYSDGTPSVETLFEFRRSDLGGYRPLMVRWSPDGRRVLHGNGGVDPFTGEVWNCVATSAGIETSPRVVQGIPGGHRYLCGFVLREDDKIIAKDIKTEIVSADGQFAGLMTELVVGARVANETAFYNQSIGLPLLTGEYSEFPAGSDGDIVVEEPAGFVTIYKIVTLETIPADATRYSPADAFTAAQIPSAKDVWPLADGLLPFFEDGEGRHFRFVGLSPDGTKAYYVVNSHVVTSDAYTNSMSEASVEAALVEIGRDGSTRGFRTGEMGATYLNPEDNIQLAGPLGRVIELSGDDLLLSSHNPYSGPGYNWVGWVGGKPWYGQTMGVLSSDARWFARYRLAETDVPGAVCITPVGAGAKPQCVQAPGTLPSIAIGFAGFGLKDEHAADAPRVLSVAQSAAYDGDEVTIFGVRFGSNGTLKVGDTPIDADDIVSWEDTRIVFTMSDAIPNAGAIVVEAGSTGSSDGGRVYRVHKTDRITTPFQNAPAGIKLSLSQGLNVVDLGGIELTAEFTDSEDLRFSPQTRLADGRYVAFSTGGVMEEAEARDGRFVELSDGGYTWSLNYELVDDIVNDGRWQLVDRHRKFSNDVRDLPSAFAHIAGDLVNLRLNKHHPYANESGRLFTVEPDFIQNPFPVFWRERSDGESAWARSSGTYNMQRLYLQLGWSAPVWGRPVFSFEPAPQTINQLAGVEEAGDTVIITGADPLHAGGAAYAVSADQGLNFGPHILVGDVLGRQSHLRDPVRVDAASGTFFLVMDSPNNTINGTIAPILGVHKIGLDGSFDADIAEIPPNLGLQWPQFIYHVPLRYAVKGGEVLLYFPYANTLVRANFDDAAPVGGKYTWETLPTSAHAQRAVSFYTEPGTDEVIVVLDDGTIMRAEDDWTAWSELDLEFDLILPTIVQPSAIGRLPDGRWIVSAKLFDGRAGAAPGTENPIARDGYLVSPLP